MAYTIRESIKRKFDNVVYTHATLNKILRNLNKSFSFLTSFRLRPFGILTVKLKSGVRFLLATNETSAVTKNIFWKGADSYEYTQVFEKLVKDCTVFADIGSNLGYYSILALRSNPAIKVHAFEPASAPVHFLQETIKINRATDKIELFPIALSDKTGHIEFIELENPDKSGFNLGGTGKIYTDRASTNAVSTVMVPTETMDEFYSKRSLPIPDLIKMDTEGTENLILNGGRRILASHKPIIICETLFNTIEKELETIMKNYGYHFYNFKNGKLHHADNIVRVNDDGVRDCFFVHPEKLHKISMFIA